jgi:hypothetical protein
VVPGRIEREAVAVLLPAVAVMVMRPGCFAVIVPSPFSTRTSARGGLMDHCTLERGRPEESIAEKDASSLRKIAAAEGVTAK